MKRIAFLIFGLFLMGACAFGEVFGNWETGVILDEWQEATGESYILAEDYNGKAWFRIYKKADGNMVYTLYASDFLESDQEYTTANLKVDKNAVMNVNGYYWGGNNSHFVGLWPEDSEASELISQMKKGSILKIMSRDYQGNNVLDKFSLNGFTEAYKWLLNQ